MDHARPPLDKALIFVVPVLASLALAACNRDRDRAPAAPAPDPVEAPVISNLPVSFEQATPFAKVGLTLPETIKSQPAWHQALYGQEVAKLRVYLDGAQSAGTEEGGEDAPVYEQTVAITAAGETGKLMSLSRRVQDFTGSQTNTLYDGLLWDKALKRSLTFGQLFRSGADLTVIDQALCSALNSERSNRGKRGTLKLGQAQGCPRALEAAPTLSVPAGAGQANGLTFRITAAQVGEAVSDEPYVLTLPVSVFRSQIAPAYASEFGG